MRCPKSEDGSTSANAKLQLMAARKLIWGGHFLVKEDLKRSFIDPRPGFDHIGARMRGLLRGFRNA